MHDAHSHNRPLGHCYSFLWFKAEDVSVKAFRCPCWFQSGYSKPDCARLIDALVVRILRQACRPWFGFVYSEDNLSDLPSREEFGLLQKLNSTRRVLVRPSLGTLGCDEPNVVGLGKPDVPVCKPGQ